MVYYSLGNSRHSSHDQFVEPRSVLNRILSTSPRGLAASLKRLWEREIYRIKALPRTLQHSYQTFTFRSLLSLPHVLVLIWFILLFWGERWAFHSSVAACHWKSWETWPPGATPHHLIFIADPQLVDPHTYTGRPWPLSTLTELHTDNFIRRSYIQLQKRLHPDTIIFLGDLFDGGREWATLRDDTEDPAWFARQRPAREAKLLQYWKEHYGEDFWLGEYNRFGRIFFGLWNVGGHRAGKGQRGRKIISSLPGNHDLGFGANIKIPVRDRFEAYFGAANRVDVIGNHTFVSVDSVSMSASGTTPDGDTEPIWGPVQEFLKGVQLLKRKAVERELRYQAGKGDIRQEHKVIEVEGENFENATTLGLGEGAFELPTILLTHVPLWRPPGTPCGPLREHWPPATPPKGQTTPVFPDERNAISVTRGYQYQNVLTEANSIHAIKSVGDVIGVFSGDDHDYCEVVHPANLNNVREITVKSISWAMGVRHPGFLMVSMWNPIDESGKSLGVHVGHGAVSSTSTTIEPHLCLLPNQLSIFIRYLTLLCLTLLVLLSRAILTPILNLKPFSPVFISSELPLLPIKREFEDPEQPASHLPNSSTSSTSSTSSNSMGLAPRASGARTRTVSPNPGASYGYTLPSGQSKYVPPSFTPPAVDEEPANWGRIKVRRSEVKKLTPLQTIFREVWTSTWRVAWMAVLWYLYLIWYG